MPPTPHAATQPSLVRRALNVALMGVYVAAIYFACDFAYTKFLYEKDRIGRIAHNDYHHGLTANFEGYETWGRLAKRSILTTSVSRMESLRCAREVRGTRVLLIGDSFTEGVGLAFDDTFAGCCIRPDRNVRKKSNSQCRGDFLLTDHLLSKNQVPARRRTEVRRGRGVFRFVRRAGRSRSYFCIDEFAIPALLLRTTLPPNRDTDPHPCSRP